MVEDGPSWAPTRALRVAVIEQRELFDEWVRCWIDEDFIEDYEAACVLRTLEREELVKNITDAFTKSVPPFFKGIK